MSRIVITEEMKPKIDKMLVNGLSHYEVIDFIKKYDSKTFITENEIRRAKEAYRNKKDIVIQAGEISNLDRVYVSRVVNKWKDYQNEDDFANSVT